MHCNIAHACQYSPVSSTHSAVHALSLRPVLYCTSHQTTSLQTHTGYLAAAAAAERLVPGPGPSDRPSRLCIRKREKERGRERRGFVHHRRRAAGHTQCVCVSVCEYEYKCVRVPGYALSHEAPCIRSLFARGDRLVHEHGERARCGAKQIFTLE